ncbi:MAG: hypothetical protein RLZZ546_1900, partial [Bacteroidota bacterium]
MLRIFTVSMLLLSCFTLLGQKKILGKPEKFLKPIYEKGNVSANISFADTPSKLLAYGNRTGNLWLVISDRQNNKCYQKPDQSTDVSHTMQFKETAYVVEEKLDWVLIGNGIFENGKLRNYKELGWIQKSKVLLWADALRDITPDGVVVKGFLLHQLKDADKLQSDRLKEIPIYPNPAVSKSDITKPLYNVYFVYKEEGDYYLIGPNNYFLVGDVDLIGWVSREKLILWNSRLAVEPCYEDAAFSFRQKNLDQRIRGFKEKPHAQKCTETNDCNNEVLWDNDPAKFKNASDLARGGKRHKGEVFRFPILYAS